MIAPAPAEKRTRSRIWRPFRAAWIQTRRLGLFFRKRYTPEEQETATTETALVKSRPQRSTVPARVDRRTQVAETSEEEEQRSGWLIGRTWQRFVQLPAPHRAWTFAATTGTVGILLLLWWQWSGRTATDVATVSEPEQLVADVDSVEPLPETSSTPVLDRLASAENAETTAEPEFSRPKPPVEQPELSLDKSPPAEPAPVETKFDLEIERKNAPAETTASPAPDKDDEFVVSSADAPPKTEKLPADDFSTTPAKESDPKWAPAEAEKPELPATTPEPEPKKEEPPPREPEKPAEPPQISTVEPGPKDLNVTITRRGPKEATVGQPLKYELVVKNNGEKVVDRVVVVDAIATEHKLETTFPVADVSENKLRWNLTNLAAGEERILEVSLLPTIAGPAESVTSVQPYASVTAGTRVEAPHVKFAVHAAKQVGVGQETRVGFSVTNTAPAPIENVRVLLDLPEGLAFEKGHALEYEVGTLAPGQSRQAFLVAKGKTLGTGTCRGQLQTGQEEIDSAEAQIVVTKERAKPASYGIPVIVMPPCCCP